MRGLPHPGERGCLTPSGTDSIALSIMYLGRHAHLHAQAAQHKRGAHVFIRAHTHMLHPKIYKHSCGYCVMFKRAKLNKIKEFSTLSLAVVYGVCAH